MARTSLGATVVDLGVRLTSERVALLPGSVHVWHAAPSAFNGPAARRECLELLDPHERERLERFRIDLDRSAYLVAHALLRSVLSVHTGAGPRDWRFVPGRTGKPAVAAPQAFRHVSFSISHCRGRVSVAIALHREVGVDVEDATRAVDLGSLAGRTLSSGEARALDAVPAQDRPARFLALWTLKEAYLKATGEGLSQPLTSSRFDFDGDPIRVSFDYETHDDPETWTFVSLALGRDYPAGLAMRRAPGESLTVYVRETLAIPVAA